MSDFEAILTGTGYPRPDPSRAGPGALIRANGLNLQFDCGRGTSMRLASLGLLAGNLDALLFTHYHSDHMTDLADLLMCRWLLDETPKPLRLVGPESFRESVDHLMHFLAPDVARRKAHSKKPDGMDVDFREFRRPKDGKLEEVFNECGVRVLAGAVAHGNVLHAVGYRVEFGGRAIAISGDTTLCDGVVDLARDADLLIHEIIDGDEIVRRQGGKPSYVIEYHSTPEQVAEMATRARAKKLVLTHIIPSLKSKEESERLHAAVAKGYKGPIIVGDDLMRFAV
ncbi:MAG: MBL fold metallo-hydrolase [Planctomycetes bacterium]|nr:MBL fold metallo-hydrolase [Planctomycetota bacterium]